jgi:hypothetical protein
MEMLRKYIGLAIILAIALAVLFIYSGFHFGLTVKMVILAAICLAVKQEWLLWVAGKASWIGLQFLLLIAYIFTGTKFQLVADEATKATETSTDQP